VQANIRWTP